MHHMNLHKIDLTEDLKILKFKILDLFQKQDELVEI